MHDSTHSDDSHPHKSAAQAPGDAQVTNPNREVGDGHEIADESD